MDILKAVGGKVIEPINDREFMKCSSGYCGLWEYRNVLIISKNNRILEKTGECKKCDCNQGEVNLYYEAVGA